MNYIIYFFHLCIVSFRLYIFSSGPDYEYVDTNDYGNKISYQGNGDPYAMANAVDLSKFNIDQAYDEKDIIKFDELDYSKYDKSTIFFKF